MSTSQFKAPGFQKRLKILLGIYAVGCLLLISSIAFAGESKWTGVDESVVEKYASKYGREAKQPLINTDQGDLLLFVFLLAGAVGGFAAGYYWRVLTQKQQNK